MFETIYWKDDRVIMLDQRALPSEEIYLEFTTHEEVSSAIKSMIIRGAPAIGVAAAMGIALGIVNCKAADKEELVEELDIICREISSTRPTAVNLFWAVDRMKKRFESVRGLSVDKIREEMKKEALAIREEDIEICKRLGKNGAELLRSKCCVLTHCNAGALATAGYGTALGVIRAAREQGKDIRVFADETRPFLQGARLTVWELMKDKIPVTLITDSMAGYFMKKGIIDAVVVGADRIAANGDTANKIGTYSVAVLAKENKIPFYVAAPLSTVDYTTKDGNLIPIEERDASEVTGFGGIRTAPPETDARNPAFDVTDSVYISGIITEAGIAFPPFKGSLAELRKKAETEK